MRAFSLFLIFALLLISTHSVVGQERLDMNQSCRSLRKAAENRGFSFVRVRQGVPLEGQMKQSKTVYVISTSFDLAGKVFHLPDSSYICFKKKGALRNGVIKGVLLNESIDPCHFGAVGNGRNDDTQALQNVLNLQVSTILLNGRKYFINGFLRVPSKVSIKGDGARIIMSAKEKAFPGFEIRQASDVHLTGIDFCAEKTKKSGSTFSRTDGTLWSNRYAVTASSIDNMMIEQCSFVDVDCAIKVDGGVGNNKNVTVRNCSTNGAVATPVYISHSDNVIIDGCQFHASTDASKYDHHLYGCASNRHHVISNCSFYGGVGIPVHYYTTEDNGEDDILVMNCSFENTYGAVIVSSGDEGILTVKNVTMKSIREYNNGVFRSGGNQTLIVDGATVYAPKQRLISCEGKDTRIKDVEATVGGLAYGLPSIKGHLSVEGCQIALRSAPYLFYISEKVAPNTGDVTLVNNRFSIDNDPEYLISVRGTTKGTVTFENNEILCRGKVKYAVYNAGKNSTRLVLKKNHIKGVEKLRHTSVKGGIIDNNTLER